ncbi:c-type cytochrome [Tenacibaculum sp. nBUS_03]|uniref:c-type cytochrome n=1 Tax=Tenacibaculum sp. nBUS_03 TaxID=3395320 RepID=UPI003EBA7970
MKTCLLISLLFILISCNTSNEKQNLGKNGLTFEQQQIVLEKIGQIYYMKNCKICHGKKGVKDQFIEYAIKNDRYEFDFLKRYLTNQDSLLKNGNKTALELKEIWNNSPYIHKFEMNENEIKSIIYYLKK